MPKKGSSQHDLDNRPRIHLTFDVEGYGSTKKKEIPFVLGVLADLLGQKQPAKKMKDREFKGITRDNFDEFMKSLDVYLKFQVEDRVTKDTNKPLEIQFSPKGIKDFGPDRLVETVPALRNLLEARDRLKALLSHTDTNDSLRDELEAILQNTEKLQQLGKETGTEPANA